MKKMVLMSLLVASFGVHAANHDVQMLNAGKDGSMVFEPTLVKAKSWRYGNI